MSMRAALVASVGGLGLVCLASVGAQAAPISRTFSQALSGTPVTISFNGVSGFTFAASNTPYGPGAAVATSGTAKVTTVGGTVGDFFIGATIDQAPTELYTFAGYPSRTVIPFSVVDDYIGLSLTLNDGVHYGYAEVYGPNLLSVGFESVAGATIATGATGSGSGITVTTPEPTSLAVLVTGLAMLSARRRNGRAPA